MSRYAIEDYTRVRHVTTKVGCAADEGGAGPREGTPVVARQGVDDEYHLSPDAVGGHPAAPAGHPLDPWTPARSCGRSRFSGESR